MEFDLDKALEEVPIHVEDTLPVAPPPSAASPLDGPWPAPSDLPAPPTPAELPPPLEHHTKSRPKPRKRTRPSRPAVGGHQGAESLTTITITIRDNVSGIQNSNSLLISITPSTSPESQGAESSLCDITEGSMSHHLFCEKKNMQQDKCRMEVSSDRQEVVSDWPPLLSVVGLSAGLRPRRRGRQCGARVGAERHDGKTGRRPGRLLLQEGHQAELQVRGQNLDPVAGSDVTSGLRPNSSVSSSSRLPGSKAPPPGVQEAAEKKRDSRKSGFFNLLKSRSSRLEKSHGGGGGGATVAPPPQPSSPAPSSSLSPVAAETTPTSPPPGARSPAAELHQEPLRAPGGEVTPTTTEAAEEQQEEVEEVEEKLEEEEEKKENPHAPRHMGVPVMGLDLLAEMKARQERMAARKVGGAF